MRELEQNNQLDEAVEAATAPTTEQIEEPVTQEQEEAKVEEPATEQGS